MASPIDVRDIEFFDAPAHLRRTGLLAYVAFEVHGLRFHGVGLRKTQRGAYVLSWPRLRVESGLVRCAVHPDNDEARERYESQVVAEARRQGIAP